MKLIIPRNIEKHRFHSWNIHEFVVATFPSLHLSTSICHLITFHVPRVPPPPFSQTTNYLALKSAFQTNRESKITRVTRKFFFFFIERIYSYSCFDSYTELIYLIYLVRRKDLFKIEYPFSAYLFKRLSKLQNVWQQTIRIENSSPTIP